MPFLLMLIFSSLWGGSSLANGARRNAPSSIPCSAVTIAEQSETTSLIAERFRKPLQTMLDSAPDQWIEVPGGAKTGRFFMRACSAGSSGDGSVRGSLQETLKWVSGKPIGTERHAALFKGNRFLSVATENIRYLHVPFAIKGRTNRLRKIGSEMFPENPEAEGANEEAMLSPSLTGASIDSIGIFLPPEIGLSDEVGYKWMQAYLLLVRTLKEQGISAIPDSPGAQFYDEITNTPVFEDVFKRWRREVQ